MSEYGFDWMGFLGLLVSLAVPGIGMMAGVWWKLHQDTEKLRHDNAIQFAATAHVISEFKLEVARNYATNNAIKEVEDRIVQAIDRLGDRLDKFVDNRNRT